MNILLIFAVTKCETIIASVELYNIHCVDYVINIQLYSFMFIQIL